VHEGGYRIQKIDNNEQRLHEQFAQQQHADDLSLFNFEKELRNDRESFNTVRKLSPTRYRFRVVDAHGHAIRNRQTANADISASTAISSSTDISSNTDVASNTDVNSNTDLSSNTDKGHIHYSTESTESAHSTRIECAEPAPGVYHYGKRVVYQSFKRKHASSIIAEQAAGYRNRVPKKSCSAF